MARVLAHPVVSPADALADSAGFLLAKVGADASRRYKQHLKPLGLEPPHAAMLRYIASAQGLSQQKLADVLQVARSRMVVLVDELERRDLIERQRSPTDRRAYALALTADGHRLLKKVISVSSQFENELAQALDPDEREQLIALLRRLAARQDIPLGVHPALADETSTDGSC